MNILVTGAAGFVGKNLVAALQNIRRGDDPAHSDISVTEVFPVDRDTDPSLLARACREADFVFHLAGVNRADAQEEFYRGNTHLTVRILEMLEEANNPCPVVFASSIRAASAEKEADPYGHSKYLAEEAVFSYGRRTGAQVMVYRLPNLFGKWCRPGYNSVVATFCHNIARDLPITVHDPEATISLLYIDDLVESWLMALSGRPCREGAFCTAGQACPVTVGKLAEYVRSFRDGDGLPYLPSGAEDSLTSRLYATYLSYLPPEKAALSLQAASDGRGSFLPLLGHAGCGQLSVSVTRPGMTRGGHYHHSKWEIFVVVSGSALVRQRQLGSDRVHSWVLSADQPRALRILPGYVHDLKNLSDTEDLVTLIWASQVFDPCRPDTFKEVTV